MHALLSSLYPNRASSAAALEYPTTWIVRSSEDHKPDKGENIVDITAVVIKPILANFDLL